LGWGGDTNSDPKKGKVIDIKGEKGEKKKIIRAKPRMEGRITINLGSQGMGWRGGVGGGGRKKKRGPRFLESWQKKGR